ncbi:MAG: S41 family peptidase [Chloroflexota bacterium]
MSRKPYARLSLVVLALFLSTIACSLFTGQPVISSAPSPDPDATASSPQDTDELFGAFWQAWDIVHEEYVDQPVDDEALMRGAIKGMLEALGDQHSSYMDPQQYKDATSGLEGEYEGIGAWVSTDEEFLTINEPMPGSPAETAGLRPGDQVIAIDGEDMAGVAPELARLKVLGPKGSTVVLTIRREGAEEPFDVTIKRARITVPSVTGEMLDGNIAYIRLYTFGDKTTSELKDALKELLPQEPKGLILDLRNNGGGYLQTAVEVASQFLDDGVVLYEIYNDKPRQTYEVKGNGLATEIPMVVLINQYSASASEILAGAIQDHGRGQLVGVQSYGKGSVQNWIPLRDDQGAVRVTIARWLTPDERLIHEVGLTPDVLVELAEEDIAADRDPQLDKAVELLSK